MLWETTSFKATIHICVFQYHFFNIQLKLEKPVLLHWGNIIIYKGVYARPLYAITTT